MFKTVRTILTKHSRSYFANWRIKRLRACAMHARNAQTLSATMGCILILKSTANALGSVEVLLLLFPPCRRRRSPPRRSRATRKRNKKTKWKVSGNISAIGTAGICSSSRISRLKLPCRNVHSLNFMPK